MRTKRECGSKLVVLDDRNERITQVFIKGWRERERKVESQSGDRRVVLRTFSKGRPKREVETDEGVVTDLNGTLGGFHT